MKDCVECHGVGYISIVDVPAPAPEMVTELVSTDERVSRIDDKRKKRG